LVSFGTNKGKLGEREIWLMGPNGEQALKFYETKEDNAICCFGWSPDAKRYAYILTNASGDSMLSRDMTAGSPITLFVSSELKLDFQLNHPRGCITSQRITQDAGRGLFQVKDLPQSWRRNDVVREAKIRLVEEIEELEANS